MSSFFDGSFLTILLFLRAVHFVELHLNTKYMRNQRDLLVFRQHRPKFVSCGKISVDLEWFTHFEARFSRVHFVRF